MQIGTTIKDRYGLPITTGSRKAAEHYGKGVDLYLSQNFGADAEYRAAIDADEGLALAHAGLALMLQLQGNITDAGVSAQSARDLANNTTRRERQHIEAIALFIDGQGTTSLTLIRELLKDYPRDILMLRLSSRLFLLGCSGAGVANFPPELLQLCRGVESQYGDDWAFLGQYSFAHHEMNLFDDSLRYAERSLELHPLNANASHSVAHVFFERGDHGGGREFLGGWLVGYDSRAAFHVHLSWHQALFELAHCRYDRAVEIYEDDIRPSVVAKSPQALADAASLLWRMQMYGGEPPSAPWGEVRDQALAAADNPGPAFRDAHAALAFSAAGDYDTFCRLTDRLQKSASDGDLLASEITLPLAQGIAAYAQGDYAEAVRLMDPIVGRLARIGGSHAQREVFEDTYVSACLKAQQFDKAQDLLTRRLKARSSVRDMVWIGSAQAHTGQMEEAAMNFSKAREGWQDADPTTPELANMERLAGSIG